MYEGYLQHDAQEVLQCILGYIQEACDTIKKEQELDRDDKTDVKVENGVCLGSRSSVAESKASTEEDNQVGSKRKSDTEVGNAKKKPKFVKLAKSDSGEETRTKPLTRSKRRFSSDVVTDNRQKDAEDAGMKKFHKGEEESDSEEKPEKVSKEADGKRKKKAKLSWLRPSGKQPSIFSKFCSMGKISSTTMKNQNKAEQENEIIKDQDTNEITGEERLLQNMAEDKKVVRHQGMFLRFIINTGLLLSSTRLMM